MFQVNRSFTDFFVFANESLCKRVIGFFLVWIQHPWVICPDTAKDLGGNTTPNSPVDHSPFLNNKLLSTYRLYNVVYTIHTFFWIRSHILVLLETICLVFPF